MHIHLLKLIFFSITTYSAAVIARTSYFLPSLYSCSLQQHGKNNIGRYAGMIAISPVPMPKVNYGVSYKQYAPAVFLAGIITKASIQHIQHDSEEPSDSDQYPAPSLESGASSQAHTLAEEYIKIYLFMLSTTNEVCKRNMLTQAIKKIQEHKGELTLTNMQWLDLAAILAAEIKALAAPTDPQPELAAVFQSARTIAKAKLTALAPILALEEEKYNAAKINSEWHDLKTKKYSLENKKALVSNSAKLIEVIETIKTVRPWSAAAAKVWGEVVYFLGRISISTHYSDIASLSSFIEREITLEDKQAFEEAIDTVLKNFDLKERRREPGDDLVPKRIGTLRLVSWKDSDAYDEFDRSLNAYLRSRNVAYVGELFDADEPEHHQALSFRKYIKRNGFKFVDSFYYRIIPTDPEIEHKRRDGNTKSLLELEGHWDSYYVSTSTLPPSQKKARRELVERYGLLEVASHNLLGFDAYIIEKDDKIFVLSDLRKNHFGVSVYQKKPPHNPERQEQLPAPVSDLSANDSEHAQQSAAILQLIDSKLTTALQLLQEYARPSCHCYY